jgi:hypothetical protein
MKSIYLIAVAAAIAGMAGNLWAALDADKTGMSSGGDRTQIQSATGGAGAGKAALNNNNTKTGKTLRKAGKQGLTPHDRKQISGNLNGDGKNSSFLKYSKANQGNGFIKGEVNGGGKNAMGDGSKGSFAGSGKNTVANGGVVKSGGFDKTNGFQKSVGGGGGPGTNGALPAVR